MTNTSGPSLVVLGAGRPYRGLTPAALVDAGSRVPALDWWLQAFSRHNPRVHFVGGYHVDEIVRRYPHLHYSLNLDWATTASAASLLSAPLDSDDVHYVAYADVVVRPGLVDRLARAAAPIAVVVDRRWQERGSPRSNPELVRLRPDDADALSALGSGVTAACADAQFVGLIRLSPEAVRIVRELRDRGADTWRTAGLPDFLQAMMERGLAAQAIDSHGEWASFDTPQEVARFILGSKADTLERLAAIVEHSRIPTSVSFPVVEWREAPEAILTRIAATFDGPVIVRSSASLEDGWSRSQAGHFTSVGAVPARDPVPLGAAIDRVIASYGEPGPRDQVLVQEMLERASAGGVVMTRTLARGGPYYVFNYEQNSHSTSGVTSGRGEQLETVFLHRSVGDAAGDRPPERPPVVTELLPSIRELEDLVGHDSLDVEFALHPGAPPSILQVRPMAADYGSWRTSDEEVLQALRDAAAYVDGARRPPPFQVGRHGAWGLMPDWNPAEIIGERPRPLAFSLYRRLVTDEVWAIQRAEFGYRDVRPAPLVVSLAGHPYVDVRASFNSFVPAAIADDLAASLVDAWLARLRREPELHDKVEFDIALTCLSFDFDRRLAAICADGCHSAIREPLRAALGDITRRGMQGVERHLAAIAVLEHRRRTLACADRPPLARAAALLSDCTRYGTLPFAHLARCAFVATVLLRSAVTEGLLEAGEVAAFLRSIESVTSGFARDTGRVASGEMTREAFLETYGHLRPGTYEITAPSYADEFTAFPALPGTGTAGEDRSFQWSEAARASIAGGLARLGLDADAGAFERFCRAAIEGREFSKFCFTRNVSAALTEIARFGESAGLSRDDLSYVEVSDLDAVLSGTLRAKDLSARVERGREWHAAVQAVELPPLIFGPEAIWCFSVPPGRPNFVGAERVVAPLVALDVRQRGEAALLGAVVMLEQADPGYDWLFAEGIAGLITVFGGANSHMAVRAAELGLPAAIGIGTRLKQQLQGARTVVLDCRSHRLEALA